MDGGPVADIDWLGLRSTATSRIVERLNVSEDFGAGVLRARDGRPNLVLSALGVIAWEGREEIPSGARYEWTGFNLLCNAAPTPFVLKDETFH